MSDENTGASQGSGSVSELQNRASHDLDQVASKAKAELDAVKERGAEDVRELGHQAKEKASEVVGQAKSFASDQKTLAANQINGVASAITKVADELDGSDQQTVARYARDLARGLSGVGKTIEDRDVDDLMGMAQDFGRTQPVAFLGAAALAGFVASRFALASAHRRDSRSAASGTSTSTQTTSAPAGATPATGTVAPAGTVRTGGY